MHSSDASAVPLNAARRVEGDLAGLDWDALRPVLAGLSRVLAYNTASIDTSGMAAALQVLADNTAFTLRERDNLVGAVGQISRLLVAAGGWRDRFTQVSLGLTQTLSRALDGIDLSIDPAALNPLLDALRALNTTRVPTREQWDQALNAVRTAATAADPTGDVLPDDLAAAVRDIAAADVGDLPLTVSRQTFTLFFGAVVLFSLMTLSFSSETADGVVSKGLELSPLAGLAMMVAGTLWDRLNGEQETTSRAPRTSDHSANFTREQTRER